VGTFLVLVAAFAALLLARQRRNRRAPARAVIVSPPKSTAIAADGAVRSLQSAEITMAQTDLDRMWNPTNLENLAATYWRFLSRVTLGLIRVAYGNNERSVVFLGRPLTLLRFRAPAYVLEPDHGKVSWQICGGLLVARADRGCGFLSLDVRRQPGQASDGQARLRIEVEVANFYPAIAAGFSTPVYEATQSAIHVLVTHAFLRSLARLDLATSRVGRLSRLASALVDRARSEQRHPRATHPHTAPASHPHTTKPDTGPSPEPDRPGADADAPGADPVSRIGLP
jgi:hypothetical protein